ncbi:MULTISPECIES: hypothetical protein [Actinoplanes]|uniref:hypothetical protein n=1 Tax=Actinoplanes TaxID=1865 RepID=UPI0005F2D3C9|nr:MULTISPECIES: hypothetical protein [Actinoplanes]GLY03933.1 hypothetical protein Acsp01_43120 [Actinoplanes sp. NBRC 101535]
MTTRTLLRGSAALAVAAVLAVSGCAGKSTSNSSGGGDSAAAGASTDKDATTALADAAAKLQEESFKMAIDMGANGTMTGVLDPKSKNSEFTMDVESEGTTIKSEMRTVDGVTYIKMTMPGVDLPGMDGKTWRKLSSEASQMGTLGSFDASAISTTMKNAADVKWDGDNAVSGTIDLAESGTSLGMTDAMLSRLTDKTAPIKATFDSEGRLATYELTMPSVGGAAAQTMKMSYSDFGTPVDVKAPAASEITA